MSNQRLEPAEGQESVWDYPRPPRLENVDKRIKVVFGGVTIAYTTRAIRVLETSHPPVYYFPPEDVRTEHLAPVEGTTFCEWKGRAQYWDLETDERTENRAAWSYPDPTPSFESLKNYLTFYPSKMDTCWVDGEKVQAQEGGFYGGWITADIVGPFKGASGTGGW
ncbi:DUF427 domain-containing protein [soil metagenome]